MALFCLQHTWHFQMPCTIFVDCCSAPLWGETNVLLPPGCAAHHLLGCPVQHMIVLRVCGVSLLLNEPGQQILISADLPEEASVCEMVPDRHGPQYSQCTKVVAYAWRILHCTTFATSNDVCHAALCNPLLYRELFFMRACKVTARVVLHVVGEKSRLVCSDWRPDPSS